jgi:hypothetical protein
MLSLPRQNTRMHNRYNNTVCKPGREVSRNLGYTLMRGMAIHYLWQVCSNPMRVVKSLQAGSLVLLTVVYARPVGHADLYLQDQR